MGLTEITYWIVIGNKFYNIALRAYCYDIFYILSFGLPRSHIQNEDCGNQSYGSFGRHLSLKILIKFSFEELLCEVLLNKVSICSWCFCSPLHFISRKLFCLSKGYCFLMHLNFQVSFLLRVCYLIFFVQFIIKYLNVRRIFYFYPYRLSVTHQISNCIKICLV